MQRTYELEQLQHWLEEAGFQLIGITGDFEVKGSVTDTTERVFFTAQKNVRSNRHISWLVKKGSVHQ
ncbi:hypothetical protein GCM10020331_038270 [Ectobacillus funiculus]